MFQDKPSAVYRARAAGDFSRSAIDTQVLETPCIILQAARVPPVLCPKVASGFAISIPRCPWCFWWQGGVPLPAGVGDGVCTMIADFPLGPLSLPCMR